MEDAVNPIKSYLSRIGRNGGKTTGPAKARTSEQASAAAKARWAKVRAETVAEHKAADDAVNLKHGTNQRCACEACAPGLERRWSKIGRKKKGTK